MLTVKLNTPTSLDSVNPIPKGLGWVHSHHYGDSQTVRIHTNMISVPFPTPDFSMPYNVITLTCTVIALFFGPIFGILVNETQPLVVEGQKASLISRLKEKFLKK